MMNCLVSEKEACSLIQSLIVEHLSQSAVSYWFQNWFCTMTYQVRLWFFFILMVSISTVRWCIFGMSNTYHVPSLLLYFIIGSNYVGIPRLCTDVWMKYLKIHQFHCSTCFVYKPLCIYFILLDVLWCGWIQFCGTNGKAKESVLKLWRGTGFCHVEATLKLLTVKVWLEKIMKPLHLLSETLPSCHPLPLPTFIFKTWFPWLSESTDRCIPGVYCFIPL